MNTVLLFLLVTTPVVGVWWLARGNQMFNRLLRDDAICREAERAESDLCARWWLR